LPAASLAVAVQVAVRSVVVTGAEYWFVLTLKLPCVQVTVGTPATPTLSVAVSVDVTVPPDDTFTVVGLKETVGAAVSGGGAVIVTVKVPVPVFPAASLAVAVHMLVVFAVTSGAVKTLLMKLPPFVHEIVGPEVTRILSVTVSVVAPVPPDSTVRVVGLNETDGEVVSATGGGGGLTVVPPLPPPPQATVVAAISGIKATVRRSLFIFMFAS